MTLNTYCVITVANMLRLKQSCRQNKCLLDSLNCGGLRGLGNLFGDECPDQDGWTCVSGGLFSGSSCAFDTRSGAMGKTRGGGTAGVRNGQKMK
jgi:hypothetical protein